ncbi:acyl-CoA dehydrogenase family protein [Pseudooceanicola nanhaiensis]|uniref:acyl-CoA dehydrogenase family protein n=1 Tax=Pseudooceanicola nanhaiensis TaxID=375761 RepID=UPI001CD55DFF|nr:acyl-CoA dehydrogenase family protein [Pseudooceanicola nanhaiensis]MCA0922587.1 acyl-CoA dehydrogenase family protein [Pseudooceanicola nanhaiensis]
MSTFHAPLDDILFSLRHVAGAERLPDWDDELAAEVIGHFASFAEGRIAPLDAVGDAQGCRLEGGRVRMPDGFAEVYGELAEQGWQGLTVPEDFGGMGLSPVMQAGVSEIFSGANHSLQMVASLVPGCVGVLRRFGSEAQQAAYLPALAEGKYLSTMALTEPGAGSDLSAIRTRAVQEDGIWRLTGEKIFISGGDQDISKGILHLVLARSGGEGVRGLSLFLCLSERADGSRNAVSVTRIEEKMGLHASPTCQLAFDGAEAELIGEEGGGLKAMFTMMNHARIDVALQGVAHAARGADLARRYAAERKQGRDATGQPVTIDAHADVARMIATCDDLARSGRVLCHLALVEEALGTAPDLVEFLTPVCKYACTEAGMKAADLAIQVMGGYGYLREYGAEQNWRDARICAIYEGTNGIHARTIATRGLQLNGGAGARAFAAFLRDSTPDLAADVAGWEAEAARLATVQDPAAEAHAFMERTCDLAMRAARARLVAAEKRVAAAA